MNSSFVVKSTAYIGLGSNLSNPAAQVLRARQLIAELPGGRERAFSSLYRSAPMGPADQPFYVNAVMALETELAPGNLLVRLQQIEQDQGRVRNGRRWGPRTLDLDILLYGDSRIERSGLIIPHYGIADRPFVLYPLQEIAPELVIPGLGPLQDLLAACPAAGLERLAS